MPAAKKPNPFAKKAAPMGKAVAKTKKMEEDDMMEEDMVEEETPFTTSSVTAFNVYSAVMKAKRFKKRKF